MDSDFDGEKSRRGRTEGGATVDEVVRQVSWGETSPPTWGLQVAWVLCRNPQVTSGVLKSSGIALWTGWTWEWQQPICKVGHAGCVWKSLNEQTVVAGIYPLGLVGKPQTPLNPVITVKQDMDIYPVLFSDRERTWYCANIHKLLHKPGTWQALSMSTAQSLHRDWCQEIVYELVYFFKLGIGASQLI